MQTAKKTANYQFLGDDLDLVVSVAPQETVILEVTDTAGETRQVATFNHMSSKNFRLKDVTAVTLTSAKPFGHNIATYVMQKSEPLPAVDVPPPPQPRNLLARMRQEARRALGAHRETFLEAQRESLYVIDDDDDRFEEEQFASQRIQNPTADTTSKGEETAQSIKAEPEPREGGAAE